MTTDMNMPWAVWSTDGSVIIRLSPRELCIIYQRVYIVSSMFVSSNVCLIISLTLFQSSLSRPHPIRGMANFFTSCSSQCCFMASNELRNVSYVGLWKYLAFVT